ncbi:MAG: hypothetical protein AAB421_01950 [Patescibacteria group bacterium]
MPDLSDRVKHTLFWASIYILGFTTIDLLFGGSWWFERPGGQLLFVVAVAFEYFFGYFLRLKQ